jgi:hypothetical protein
MGVKMAVPVLGAAIVSGRDAAKFLDPIVEAFDQVALR